ncbi:MAG: glycosyltransferase [Candidatus Omnitrophota bacterium]|nr:glycosyltransferase [Candidatus Omnitrophota bacterium]
MKKVSVIIPAMNEENNIGYLLDEISKITTTMKNYQFEVIVVDDHSKDKTAVIARSKNVKVVNNLRKPGKGYALISGFEVATGEYLVMMDADCSHRPEDIPLFIDTLEKGAGLVIGSRIYGSSDEYTRVRAFGNIVLTLVFGLLYNRYLSDALNGYKAFQSEIFKKFEYTSRDFEIEIELLVNTLRAGMKIVEIPSHERVRKSGFSKSKVIKHGVKFLNRIIKEWLRDNWKKVAKQKVPHKHVERIWLDNMYVLDRYNRWFFSHIENYLGDKIWEVGSGLGTFSKFLLNKNQLILSDIVDEYLEKLRKDFSDYKHLKVLKIDLLDNSHQKIIKQYEVNTILSINVLEHIQNEIEAIKFMYSVLRKDGIFIFVGPHHKFLYNSLDKHANHYRRYSQKEITHIFSNLGFTVDKVFMFNTLGVLSWFWYGNILRKKVIPLRNLKYYNEVIPLVNLIDSVNPFRFGLNIVVIARKII